MNFYEQNRQALQQKDPELAKQIAQAADDAQVSVQNTSSGLPILLVHQKDQTYALHHPNDPWGYCQSFLSSIEGFSGARNIALLGGGLFYLPRLIIQNHSELQRFYIFEPSVSVFRAAMQMVDLTPVLRSPATVPAVGNRSGDIYRALAARIMEVTANSLLLIESPPETAPFPEWVAAAKSQIQEAFQFGQSGLLTKFKDGPLCLENLFCNLDTLAAGPGLRDVGEVFRNRPAIIVAAGPSLVKNIDQLQSALDRFLIFATDTAYETLLRCGVVPQLVVTVDPTELNLCHFNAERYPSESVLLLDPEARPEIAGKFSLSMSYLTDKHPFFLWLDRQLGGKGILQKGAMVSQAGLYAANYLGCDPIILIGQDLALDPASGATHYTETALCRTVQFVEGNREQIRVPLPHSPSSETLEPLFWVEGVAGNPVPTTQNMLVYLRMLEGDIRRLSVRVIDATEGGAKIAGTDIRSLRDVMESVGKSEEDLIKVWKECRDRWSQPKQSNSTPILKHLFHERLQARLRIAQEGLNRLAAQSHLSVLDWEKQVDEYRQRIFSDPVSEYLIEYGAPRELFEFLKLGAANRPESEKKQFFRYRYQKLFESVQVAVQRLEKYLMV